MPPSIKIGEKLSSAKSAIAYAFNKFFAGAALRLMNSLGSTVSEAYHNYVRCEDTFDKVNQRPLFSLTIQSCFAICSPSALSVANLIGLMTI